jgi:signal transduction histidine kinase
MLAALGLVIAFGSYPAVRYVTRRLERLQAAVESVGSGDLTARVRVEGNDEVARLARSFNDAVNRIEKLLAAHKLLLANVSHELRTPLARLRMTVEFLKDVADPRRKADLEADIEEIDALLEQILLSSRLEAVTALDIREELDLLALVAEEASRCPESDVGGESVTVGGDPSLLRRMVRNLIENAHRHGQPPVKVVVARSDNAASLTVSDAGQGIVPEERERLFTPFHRSGLSSSSGSGLGLALVRQIARRHGGEAVCRESSAGNTIFEVKIPTLHTDG